MTAPTLIVITVKDNRKSLRNSQDDSRHDTGNDSSTTEPHLYLLFSREIDLQHLY
jgi:hypothetical protein